MLPLMSTAESSSNQVAMVVSDRSRFNCSNTFCQTSATEFIKKHLSFVKKIRKRHESRRQVSKDFTRRIPGGSASVRKVHQHKSLYQKCIVLSIHILNIKIRFFTNCAFLLKTKEIFFALNFWPKCRGLVLQNTSRYRCRPHRYPLYFDYLPFSVQIRTYFSEFSSFY